MIKAPSLNRVFNGGTVTVSTPLLDHSQTWNDAAVTFTGWKLNITDTASAAASLLIDLQKGGVSQFKVTKSGELTVTGQLIAGTHVQIGSSSALYWGSRTNLLAPADGQLKVTNNAGTSHFTVTIGSGANARAAFSGNVEGVYLEASGGRVYVGGSSGTRVEANINGQLETYTNAGAGGWHHFLERTDVTAPSADNCVLYARDNGGKTELVARFATGAIQRVAIEP